VATAAEPMSRAAANSRGMGEIPPVSGSSLEGEELLVALEVGLAEAEALPVALVVAEAGALETALAVALSSVPRSSAPRAYIPLSSAPMSPLRRVRRPTRPTPPIKPTIPIYALYLLVFACVSTTRMYHAKLRDLCKFMELS